MCRSLHGDFLVNKFLNSSHWLVFFLKFIWFVYRDSVRMESRYTRYNDAGTSSRHHELLNFDKIRSTWLEWTISKKELSRLPYGLVFAIRLLWYPCAKISKPLESYFIFSTPTDRKSTTVPFVLSFHQSPLVRTLWTEPRASSRSRLYAMPPYFGEIS